MKRRNRAFLIVGSTVGVLVAARLALPTVVEYYVNRQLQALDSYTGQIGDVDMALWRGAYRVEDLIIEKRSGANPVPFLTSVAIDLSLEWRSLFNGALVGEAVIEGASLNLIEAADKQQEQLGSEVDWRAQLQEIFPFRFNTIRVTDSVVTFRTPGISTQDSLTARDVNGTLANLTNAVESAEDAFAHFDFAASVLGKAPLRIEGQVDPYAEQPRFDVNVTQKAVPLSAINPWLREYVNIDAQSGSFEMYMELSAAEGRFEGYVKPLLQNVDITNLQEDTSGILQRLWEGVVELTAEIFENQPEEQVAAQIPIAGKIEDPRVGIFQSVVSVLRNAFVGAFAHSLNNSVSLRTVEESAADDTGEERRDAE